MPKIPNTIWEEAGSRWLRSHPVSSTKEQVNIVPSA